MTGTSASARIGWISLPLFVFAMALYRGYAGDDTFIHLQYARNLAEGNGFAFNPGEPSYGSTSPLWTLLVAGAGSLTGGRFYAAAKLLSVGFALGTLVFFYLLARRLIAHPTLAAAAVLLLAFDPWFLKWAGSGMETSAALFVVVSALWFYLHRLGQGRLPASAFLLGWGTLLRPELVGLFLVLLVDRLFVRRRPLTETAVALFLYLVPIAPWLLFAQVTFGHFVPNTVLAKSGALDWTDGLWRTAKVYGATYAPILSGALVALRVVLRRGHGWSETVPLWGWAIGLPVAYVVTGSYVASRYLLLAVPPLVLLAMWGVAHAWHRRAWILVSVALAVSVVVQATVIVPRTRFARGVDEGLIDVAEWIRLETPPNALIALHEVGAVGYFCERRVIDTAGLVTPETLPYVREFRVPELLSARRPDYYVSSGDERTDRQVFDAFRDRMTLEFERSVQRGGSSARFRHPQPVGVYRFQWE